MTCFEKLLAILLFSVILLGAAGGGAVAALSGGSQLLGALAGLLFAGYFVAIGYVLYQTERRNGSRFLHGLVEEAKRIMQEGRVAENQSYLCLECGGEIPGGRELLPWLWQGAVAHTMWPGRCTLLRPNQPERGAGQAKADSVLISN
ncbi:hypothetical protein AKJ41_04755 [candidate division MSBL1 archaeon SCGC-AAA259O05]|uniref:Uncharacterized protein n=1 Tax=candidate division MSBL1 archaeon SCGC-AAA259O05 TaxID=1698271 RepID=A0A133V081_9EURY|nr:hypothetical protein AKJ41_04755 [candidate division MSBL1 archaeon SCGC-AAA259O05]